MKPWNPDKCLAYADLHSQAIEDLVAHIEVDKPRSIVDLGCGPGNSTEWIAARWPHAAITGVDMASEMLERGREKHPDWHWVHSGIEEFHPARAFDIVVSCAALQWLPNHVRLLPQLWELVRTHGALAVQMPSNQKSPLHRAVFRTAQSETWRQFTGRSKAVLNFQPPAEYFSILAPLAGRLEVWETIYHHEMRSLDSLLDWAKETVMRPFLDKIPTAARRRGFVADVKRACAPGYPRTVRGTILYAQKRLFFVAYKDL
ncbi:MAG: methyltransferase domain-containing protein [Terracidiphilus sp.]